MRYHPAGIGRILAAADRGQDVNLFPDSLHRRCIGQPAHRVNNKLLVCHGVYTCIEFQHFEQYILPGASNQAADRL